MYGNILYKETIFIEFMVLGVRNFGFIARIEDTNTTETTIKIFCK